MMSTGGEVDSTSMTTNSDQVTENGDAILKLKNDESEPKPSDDALPVPIEHEQECTETPIDGRLKANEYPSVDEKPHESDNKAVETAPAPAPAPVPEPVAAPVPEPMTARVPEPVAATVPEPVAAPVPEPVAAPVPEPVAAPVPEPVAAPVPEPVAASVPEPVAAPVSEPVAAPVPEPVAAPVSEPVAAPVPEPVAAPVPEPVAAPVPEPVAAPVLEPEAAPVLEPEAAPVLELGAAPASEASSTPEAAPESTSVPAPVESKKEEEEKSITQEETHASTAEEGTPKITIPKQKRKKTDEPAKESSVSGTPKEKVGILEEPPMIEDGVKRARKKVQRLSDVIDKSMAEKEDKHMKVPEGSGVPLGEIEFIKRMIKTSRPEDLKCLHLIATGRVGTQSRLRISLRQFCGFEFEADSPEYNKKLTYISGKKLNDLRSVGKIIGLSKTSMPRDELSKAILDFLIKPKDVGPPPPAPKKRGRGKGKSTTSKGDSKGKSKSKEKGGKKKKEESDDEEMSEEESPDEEEKPKAKKTKKTPAKKEKAPKRASPKKVTKGKKRSSKAAAKEEEISDISDDSIGEEEANDEPAAKRAKKMPSDEELKKTVLGLLENVDLERVTMKNVLQQIYEKYEGLDLTHKKEYLKSVVKDILSS